MTRILCFVLSVFAALTVSLGTVRAQERSVPVTKQQVTLSFAAVVKQATPAVVNIFTKRTVKTKIAPMFDDPFFRRFFGDDAGAMGFPRERVEQSLGSGVIVRAGGVIITNHHVAANADQIRVVLSDKREFEAKIVGSDERSDLAVLQLQNVTETLPFLELAESDEVEVGDLVLAIGNPFGVGQTVTSGIVSALARTSIGISDFRSFIQTDAAINPGNSGGALITSDGRLIGINTAIYSRDGGSVGIGFAIPSNMVRTVLASILKQGRAVRAWFGATGQTVTADLAKSLGLPRPQGVAITRVSPGGPAARAGIKVEDIVRKVNAHVVDDAEELRYLLATLPLGGTADLVVTRGGVERIVKVALEAAPDTPARGTKTFEGRHPFTGATVANLNPALAEELGREFEDSYVIVTKVAPNSIAARLGLQGGDLVLDVNETSVKSVDQLAAMLTQQTPGWVISVSRGGRVLKVSVGN